MVEPWRGFVASVRGVFELAGEVGDFEVGAGARQKGRGGRSGEVKAAYRDFKGLIVRLTEDTHGGTPK